MGKHAMRNSSFLCHALVSFFFVYVLYQHMVVRQALRDFFLLGTDAQVLHCWEQSKVHNSAPPAQCALLYKAEYIRRFSIFEDTDRGQAFPNAMGSGKMPRTFKIPMNPSKLNLARHSCTEDRIYGLTRMLALGKISTSLLRLEKDECGRYNVPNDALITCAVYPLSLCFQAMI